MASGVEAIFQKHDGLEQPGRWGHVLFKDTTCHSKLPLERLRGRIRRREGNIEIGNAGSGVHMIAGPWGMARSHRYRWHQRENGGGRR